jgi:CMP-N-acetylneuraminic acid synthetase
LPEFRHVQSQYFPECFVSNGSQYWLWTKAYLEQRTFYVNNLNPYLTNGSHILNINAPEDFVEAKERAKGRLV